jgi:hypothetical protein
MSTVVPSLESECRNVFMLSCLLRRLCVLRLRKRGSLELELKLDRVSSWS